MVTRVLLGSIFITVGGLIIVFVGRLIDFQEHRYKTILGHEVSRLGLLISNYVCGGLLITVGILVLLGYFV